MRFLWLVLVLTLFLPMPVMAVKREKRDVEPSVPESMRALDFEEAATRTNILPVHAKNLNYETSIADKLHDVDLTGAARKVVEKPLNDDDRRQGYRHFMPCLSGLTGLIDIPVAYTQPEKTFVVTVQHERVRADERWWRLPYKSISSDMTFGSLNYGATKNIELSVDGELWDKTIQYNDPVRFSDPTFTEKNLNFVGIGSKWNFPFGTTAIERVWFALGFRAQLYDNQHRNVTEVHEYDRFSNIFFSASTKATEELFGHFMIKYVSYDFAGGRFPSGQTDLFEGFSPTNAWTQWGFGLEWYVFPDFEIIGEVTREANVIFVDVDGPFNQFNANVGARYHRDNIGVGFFAKRVNHHGLSDTGLQAALRF